MLQRRVRTRQARDPITLDRVRTPFGLARGGTVVVYDAHALCAYVTATGDVRDPVTRQEYAPHELHRLARVCGVPALDAVALQTAHRDEVGRREVLAVLLDALADDVTLLADVIALAAPGELARLQPRPARVASS